MVSSSISGTTARPGGGADCRSSTDACCRHEHAGHLARTASGAAHQGQQHPSAAPGVVSTSAAALVVRTPRPVLLTMSTSMALRWMSTCGGDADTAVAASTGEAASADGAVLAGSAVPAAAPAGGSLPAGCMMQAAAGTDAVDSADGVQAAATTAGLEQAASTGSAIAAGGNRGRQQDRSGSDEVETLGAGKETSPAADRATNAAASIASVSSAATVTTAQVPSDALKEERKELSAIPGVLEWRLLDGIKARILQPVRPSIFQPVQDGEEMGIRRIVPLRRDGAHQLFRPDVAGPKGERQASRLLRFVSNH